MSRRKLKMLFWTVAALLAFVPFLQGCATDDGRDDATGGGTAEEQQQNDGQNGNDAGEANDVQAESVEYGQIDSIDGSEVTVLLGEYATAAQDEDSQYFAAGEDVLTFSLDGLKITNESGDDIDKDQLAVGDIVEMKGTGEDADFMPESIGVIDTANAADAAADDAASDSADASS